MMFKHHHIVGRILGWVTIALLAAFATPVFAQ
jgi:hypothetical protein